MIEVRKVSTDWGKGMPSGLTYFFIGQPKTGKTTACASWSEKGSDGVLVLDTDLGAEFDKIIAWLVGWLVGWLLACLLACWLACLVAWFLYEVLKLCDLTVGRETNAGCVTS